MNGDEASEEAILRAADLLAHGGLVAFPTETVYGLGADASNEAAVRRIFLAKGRPADHPVIVHVAGSAQLASWVRHVPEPARRLAEAFWPGPLTMVLERAEHVLDIITGGQNTVGIRVPSHPVAQKMLRAFGGGVAGPSANRFGHVSPTTAAHVRAEFGDSLDMILEGGQSEVGIESTIVDLSRGHPFLLRPGIISVEQLEAVLGETVRRPDAHSPRASGTLASHYAPTTPTRLVAPDALERTLAVAGVRVGVLARRPRGANLSAAVWVEAPDDAGRYAHELYADLRYLDTSRCDLILVEQVPDSREWDAIRDRIGRAASPERN